MTRKSPRKPRNFESDYCEARHTDSGVRIGFGSLSADLAMYELKRLIKWLQQVESWANAQRKKK